MIYDDNHEPVGELEHAEITERARLGKDLTKISKAILQVTMLLLMGLGPTQAVAQEEMCHAEERQQSNDSFWMFFLVAALFLTWLVFIGIAVWFWKRLDRRIYWNEVQQAETDTLLGSHRDQLSDLQRHVRRVDNDLRAQVHQNNIEGSVLEDLITTTHYGLVEIGGFVRFSELTAQQRQSMLAQERANQVLFDMRRRSPDDTDETTRAGGTGTGGRPGSSTAGNPPPASAETGGDHEMEDGEEEGNTDDEMGDGGEADTVPPDGDQLARLLGNLRRLINEALSSERFEDASELQPAVMATLSACSRNTGLDMELVTTGRNCFQRLYRRARNRGSEGLAATFRLYADDFQRLLV